MKNSTSNRAAYLRALNLDPRLLSGAEQQMHGKEVIWVKNKDLQKQVKLDAFITDEPNLIISVRVADCLPIYVYDPTKQTVAIIHAGWRGLAQEIIKATINQLGDPKQIKAGVGPCIQSCHFEVQPELLQTFSAYPEAIESKEGRHFIDLPKIAQTQLMNLGLLKENIELNTQCTFESNNLFSYRRDKPAEAEAMLAGIYLDYSSSSSDSSKTKT